MSDLTAPLDVREPEGVARLGPDVQATIPGTRYYFYDLMGGLRPPLPPHANFGLPVTPEARFSYLFRIRGGQLVQRQAYLRGRPVDDDLLTAEVLEARDAHAAKASAALPASLPPFEGVAIGVEIVGDP